MTARRDDGFAVMDVSVTLTDDPKVRKLFRLYPADLATAAFMAYVATLGQSWGEARRIPIDEAWPSVLPWDDEAIAALRKVKLIDAKGLIPAKPWRVWFEPALARRGAARARWDRANAARRDRSPTAGPPRGNSDVTATLPRGHREVTSTPVPYRSDSAPSVRDTPPPPAERGSRADGTNLRSIGAAPRQLGSSPRDLGQSPRQVRAAEKRDPTPLAAILRQVEERRA